MGSGQVVRLIVTALATCMALPVTAGIELSIGSKLGYTDNARRSDSDKISERRYEVGASIAADYETATLRADGRYSLVRKWYSERSGDNRNSIVGDLTLHWQQIENLLRWELSNLRTRVVQDNTRAAAESNIEDRSLSSIAAVLTLGNSASYLTLAPRFTDISYQESSRNDQQRSSIELAYTRHISPITKVVFSAIDEEVDSASRLVAIDYDKRTYAIALQRELRRMSYAMSVGRSKVERSALENVDSDFWSASVAYDYGIRRLAVAASRSVTDTGFGNGNIRISGITVTDEGDVLLDIARDPSVPDIVILTRYGLEWQDNVLCDTCTLDVSFDIDRSDFVARNETEREWIAAWDFKRKVTNVSSVGFMISPRKVDFSGARDNFDYEALRWRASASSDLSTDVEVYFRLEHEMRDGGTLDYDVNTAVIGFDWQLLD